MKKLILILMLSASFAASAQTVGHKIIVQSQGLKPIYLSKADVKYIFTQTANESIRGALALNPQTIKNNDVADNIITIMNYRKK